MSREIPAKELYKFIDQFDTQHEFAEFARSELLLTNVQINDIIADYPSSREQKYQMLCKWCKKLGRRATLPKLYELKDTFDRRNDTDGGEEPQNQNPPPNSNIPIPGFLNQVQPVNLPQRTTSDMPDNESSEISSGEPRQNPPYDFSFPRNQTTRPLPRSEPPPPATPPSQRSSNEQDRLARMCDRVENIHVISCTPDEIDALIRRDDVYPILHDPKGYVLIINNNFIGQDQERRGAKKDVKSMEKLWKDFKCRVSILEDKSAEEIKARLKKLSGSQKASMYDFIAVFIMSHGEMRGAREVFLGADNEPVEVATVLSYFDNDKAKSLAGIPKLFFFQFCRGVIVDSGVPLSMAEDDLNQRLASLCEPSCEPDGPVAEPLNPTQVGARQPFRSDFLISYATQAGFLSYRNGDGSWFINSIAHNFMEHARTDHVADLMTRVREAVSVKDGRTRINEHERVPCKEMSETRSLLRKKLFLMPGYPADDLDD